MKLSASILEKIDVSFRVKRQLLDHFWKGEEKYRQVIPEKNYAIDGKIDHIDRAEWVMFGYRFRNGDSFIDRFIREHKKPEQNQDENIEGVGQLF